MLDPIQNSVENEKPENTGKKKRIIIYLVAGVLAAAIIAAFIILLKSKNDTAKALEDTRTEVAALQIDNQTLRMDNDYKELEESVAFIEGQKISFNNDSIRAEYEKAKNRVEQLREELNRRDKLSQQRINELQNEIATLKNLIHHYLEIIDDLQKENQSLKQDNQSLTERNRQLSNQVTQTASQNKELSQRMELAEKLNVSSVSLQALNSKGKNEKKVKKAKQLAVTFTIPQNNSTPVGRKTIYLRITSPEGNLLKGNGITFPFEGATLEASAKKDVEYEGNEIPGVTIYWDNSMALNPGPYLVELFADNYRLFSRSIELN